MVRGWEEDHKLHFWPIIVLSKVNKCISMIPKPQIPHCPVGLVGGMVSICWFCFGPNAWPKLEMPQKMLPEFANHFCHSKG